jgi:DNA-binding winged helix-turn-helix (wHTH) protein
LAYIFLTGGLFFALQPVLEPRRSEATQRIGSLRYLFEEYAFDTDRRELHRGADVMSVAPQVFDLLDYLIRNREHVVSKDDLIKAIWDGRIVSDAALTTRVNVARSAIGDSGEEQRLIKTLPRKGFRFVGMVREANQPSDAALARFRGLFVIARNSSFTYKGKAVDVKQVGRELGVRYLLEGSVRKAGNHIRIAGQLIDAETGAHLWADRFDGALKDVFNLQDHVTVSVVGAIAPTLMLAEIKRAERKPTENLDAHDHYLRGLASARLWTRDGNSQGLDHFRKAIELDPDLAAAYAMAAWCYLRRKLHGWMDDPTAEIGEAVRLARKAVHLGQDRALPLCMGGYVLSFFERDFDEAAALIDRSLAINPNSAYAWGLGAWVRVWRGEPDLAIEHAAKAERPSPLDPSMYGIRAAAAYAHFLLHRYDVASSLAEQARHGNPNFVLSVCISAASNAFAGRIEAAQRAITRALECDPGLRLSNLKNLTPFERSEDFALFADGLSKAGLPG